MNNTAINVVLADSPALLQAVYDIRRIVFIEEQHISRDDEFDQHESTCRHFLARNSTTNKPLGSARWRVTSEGIKLERFCVLPEFRGKGAGSALVAAVMKDIQRECSLPARLYLHAQISALPLYLKSGFHVEGDEYIECGIPHVTMRRTLDRA